MKKIFKRTNNFRFTSITHQKTFIAKVKIIDEFFSRKFFLNILKNFVKNGIAFCPFVANIVLFGWN